MSQSRLLSALLCVLLPAVAAAEETRLLRRPTVSRDLVVFAYGSDLWAVGRTGGQARRLTATPFVETDPRLSPDGSRIAFTATVGGNTDVYVIPAAGGEPVASDVSPGDRRGTRLEPGWAAHHHRVDTRRRADPWRQSLFQALDDRHREDGIQGRTSAARRAGTRGRPARPAATAPRVHRRVFAGRPPHGVRGRVHGDVRRVGAGAEQPVAALPRRAHASDSRHRPRQPRRGEAAVD